MTQRTDLLLQDSITCLFEQIEESINVLTDDQFTVSSAVLSHATIGQHLRHIIECFQELINGYDAGLVNYDKRRRDLRIETDRVFALGTMKELQRQLGRPNKELLLDSSLNSGEDGSFAFDTNYNRELLYNLEHMVHHMAFMRTGIQAVTAINLPATFGVAGSTLQYRKTCAR